MSGRPPMLPGLSYVRPLGAGGFADVYLYEQDLPRRVVAVKVLHGELVDDAARRVFHAEADVLARLSTHPSVVTIHQASIAPDGRPYLVMEFCPDSLGARAKRAPARLDEVLDAGVRVACALETAHRSGVLHRDVKPSNLLVTTIGSPVLADFGIAAAVSGQQSATVAMSVPWSSPEVLDGRIAGSVPAELWSLAATLHTLLVGRAPFELAERAKNSREAMSARIVRGGPQPLGRADVPDRVEQILRRAMSTDPAKRQPSMLAFAEELRWAQYEMGWAPTALEIADTDWARGAAPVDLDDAAPRGPVISRVGAGARRAARAARAAQVEEVDRDGLLIAGPAHRAARRAGWLGAAGGAAALGLVLLALNLLGVL